MGGFCAKLAGYRGFGWMVSPHNQNPFFPKGLAVYQNLIRERLNALAGRRSGDAAYLKTVPSWASSLVKLSYRRKLEPSVVACLLLLSSTSPVAKNIIIDQRRPLILALASFSEAQQKNCALLLEEALARSSAKTSAGEGVVLISRAICFDLIGDRRGFEGFDPRGRKSLGTAPAKEAVASLRRLSRGEKTFLVSPEEIISLADHWATFGVEAVEAVLNKVAERDIPKDDFNLLLFFEAAAKEGLEVADLGLLAEAFISVYMEGKRVPDISKQASLVAQIKRVDALLANPARDQGPTGTEELRLIAAREKLVKKLSQA